MEACGLLGGTYVHSGASTNDGWDTNAQWDSDRAEVFYPTDNDAKSARVYAIPPRQQLRAELNAEDAGLSIVGVVHSHTHTDAYPSPTDVAMAPDPAWHYLIVSLRDMAPVLRSFLIVDGNINEEPVILYGE